MGSTSLEPTSAGTTESTDTTDATGSTDTTDSGETTSTAGDESSSSTGGPGFVLCDDSDADLRACYDFADVGGGVLDDLSMYGNDGEVGAVGEEAGPFGGAVRVSETAEISVPDSESLDVLGPATLEAWVHFDSLPAMGDRVGILDNDGQYSMIVFGNGGLRCNGGGISAFAAVPTEEWVHLACRFDGDEMSAWVDGVEVESETGGAPFNVDATNPMSLGDSSPAFEEPMDGLLAAVRVWSVARSDDDIVDAAAVR